MRQNRSICVSSRVAFLSHLLVVLFCAQSVVADEPLSPRYTKTVKAIRQAEPAVVNIEGNKPASTVGGGRDDSQQVNGMGAGVIIDSKGYILTNQHVVQDVGRIEVTLNNGRVYIGRLIARDAATDLALIKIDSRNPLPVISCGTSSDLMRGEPVIAIGNPFGYHNTVTVGIISALHRDIPVNGVQDYPDLIQTDASINPGNSGGPLLNAEGKMIGINAAVRMGAQGIGFAIPVDRAVEVAADMITRHRRGSVDSPVQVSTVFGQGRSQVRVDRSSQKDLRPGDIISRINGREIQNRLNYELSLVGLRNGASPNIEIRRNGEAVAAKLNLGGRNSSTARLTSTASSTVTVKERVFRKFGLRLEAANSSQVSSVDPSYKGGLRVTAVRQNSPAYVAQIQTGDILVGLLEWQTPNWDDLDWILKSAEMKAANDPTFHIMRGKDVFWGNLEL